MGPALHSLRTAVEHMLQTVSKRERVPQRPEPGLKNAAREESDWWKTYSASRSTWTNTGPGPTRESLPLRRDRGRKNGQNCDVFLNHFNRLPSCSGMWWCHSFSSRQWLRQLYWRETVFNGNNMTLVLMCWEQTHWSLCKFLFHVGRPRNYKGISNSFTFWQLLLVTPIESLPALHLIVKL